MADARRIVLVGLGGVGSRVASLLAERSDARVVAAWSRRADHAGRGLDEVAAGADAAVRVAPSLEQALATPADAAIVATASRLRDVGPQLRACVEAGLHVITTAEEAAQPWAADRELAEELDALARRRGVAILGCGVNPGLVFDALVLTLAGAAARVDRVEVERIVDLGRFSPAVQRRIGIGHTPEEFAAGRASGEITGHVGFPQSMRVVARALERPLDRIDSEIKPIMVAGRSAGFVQRYVGHDGDVPWFEARLTGHADLARAGLRQRDEIRLHGDPDLRLELDPGLDAQATVTAVVANSIRRVCAAEPGWRTVAELPPAHATR